MRKRRLLEDVFARRSPSQLDVKWKDTEKSVIRVACGAQTLLTCPVLPSRCLLLGELNELHGAINRESAVGIEHVTDWYVKLLAVR